MAGVIGWGVTLRGYHAEHAIFTFHLAAGITQDDIGKAVSIDTAAPNSVKLAADGEFVFGRLETVEDRVTEGMLVGAVAVRFSNTLPYTGTVAVGNTAVGSTTPGLVRAAAAADHSHNVIVEVDEPNGHVVVVKM